MDDDVKITGTTIDITNNNDGGSSLSLNLRMVGPTSQAQDIVRHLLLHRQCVAEMTKQGLLIRKG